MLDFSWICFGSLDRFFDMASFNSEYVLNLLQTTLLYSRIEDEHELLINSNLYKQIDHFRGKIIETKKRIHSLAISKNQLKASSNTNSNSDQQLVARITPSRSSNSVQIKTSNSNINNSASNKSSMFVCCKIISGNY